MSTKQRLDGTPKSKDYLYKKSTRAFFRQIVMEKLVSPAEFWQMIRRAVPDASTGK